MVYPRRLFLRLGVAEGLIELIFFGHTQSLYYLVLRGDYGWAGQKRGLSCNVTNYYTICTEHEGMSDCIYDISSRSAASP